MAEKQRAILGAVRSGGRVYVAGQEAELAKVLGTADAARLAEAGILAGAWGGEDAAEPPTGGDGGSDLPADLPGREQLIAGGFATREAVAAASDADLEALPKIGKATVQKIREALA